MRITTKGQVTIPIDIRRQLGLLPLTEVEFDIDGDGVRLRRAPEGSRERAARAISALKGSSTVRMTTDEIMELTRGDK